MRPNICEFSRFFDKKLRVEQTEKIYFRGLVRKLKSELGPGRLAKVPYCFKFFQETMPFDELAIHQPF